MEGGYFDILDIFLLMFVSREKFIAKYKWKLQKTNMHCKCNSTNYITNFIQSFNFYFFSQNFSHNDSNFILYLFFSFFLRIWILINQTLFHIHIFLICVVCANWVSNMYGSTHIKSFRNFHHNENLSTLEDPKKAPWNKWTQLDSKQLFST